MILNEDEAKTKVCPVMSGPAAVAEVGSWIEKTNCLASGCMAWRWLDRKSPKELEARKSWPLIPNTNEEPPVGYCGA